MTLGNIPFENIVGKAENAGNHHFLLFLQCFQPFHKQIPTFQSHIFCLQMLSIYTSLKCCHLGKQLTHYQMTNFRLFQTERVCRRQFQIWQKVIQTGRKRCGKRRNCLLRAISLLVTNNFSFSHSVFKRLDSQGHQKVSLCGNGLTNHLEV